MTKKTDTKIDPETQAGDAPQDGAAISDDDLQDVINNAAESDAGDANAAASRTTDAETGAQSDPLTAMTAERDALKDQLLQALAETENMRRRSDARRKPLGNMGIHNLPVIWSVPLIIWHGRWHRHQKINRHLMTRCNHCLPALS